MVLRGMFFIRWRDRCYGIPRNALNLSFLLFTPISWRCCIDIYIYIYVLIPLSHWMSSANCWVNNGNPWPQVSWNLCWDWLLRDICNFAKNEYMKLLEQPGPSTLALHLWMKSSNTMNLQYMNEPWMPWHRLSRGENMRNDRNGSRGLFGLLWPRTWWTGSLARIPSIYGQRLRMVRHDFFGPATASEMRLADFPQRSSRKVSLVLARHGSLQWRKLVSF